MLNQSTQQLIGPITAALGAAVDILLMGGAFQMLIQCTQGRELSRAQVAFIAVTVPCSFRSKHLGGTLIARHSQHWSSDDIVSVQALDDFLDLVTIQAGRTGARFEMDGQTGGGDV